MYKRSWGVIGFSEAGQEEFSADEPLYALHTLNFIYSILHNTSFILINNPSSCGEKNGLLQSDKRNWETVFRLLLNKVYLTCSSVKFQLRRKNARPDILSPLTKKKTLK